MSEKQADRVSAKGLKWKLSEPKPHLKRNILSRKVARHGITAAALAERTDDLNDARAFLNTPDFDSFMKTTFRHIAGMNDFEASAKRLADAIEKGEKIGISGDYDCDGNCSVALMCRFLMQSGVPTEHIAVHIPNRELEGYGVNDKAVHAMLEKNIDLLVTLDNGTAAYEPIKKAAAGGMSVIVADHHGNKASDGLPNALVVNPNRHDETARIDGIKDMAAVGVTFMLCTRATEILAERGHYRKEINGVPLTRPEPKSWLGLTALATLGDVVDVSGPINRMLVKEGIDYINSRQDPFINALLESAQLRSPINAESVQFTLAPIINAPGRLGQSVAWAFLSDFASQDHAGHKSRLHGMFQKFYEMDESMASLSEGYDPFFSDMPPEGDADFNDQESNALERLNRQVEALEERYGADPKLREARLLMLLSRQCNEERKELEWQLLQRARERAEQQLKDEPDRGVIVVANDLDARQGSLAREKWHPGLIGIVAGRLKEVYNLPVVVGSFDEKQGIFKCSARSIKVPDHPVDIGSAFRNLKSNDVFTSAGGHPMAAGGSFTFGTKHEAMKRFQALKDGLESELGHTAKVAKDAFRLPISGIINLSDLERNLHGGNVDNAVQSLHDAIAQLEPVGPFGEGNLKPKILIPNVYLTNREYLSRGKHMQFKLTQEGSDIVIPGVAFHIGGTHIDRILNDSSSPYLSLVGTLGIWPKRGKSGSEMALQFRLDDVFVQDKDYGTQNVIECLDRADEKGTSRRPSAWIARDLGIFADIAPQQKGRT